MISQRLQAKAANVGDFEVQRILPQVDRRFVGPICFVDHFGPHQFIADPNGGVGPHPHIGLATVTYLFEGQTLHRDSLGTEQLITPGAVNFMTAGSGITHSERAPATLRGQQTTSHGLQLWVGLPTAAEETAPSFQHAPLKTLPLIEQSGVELRVLLGEWGGLRSPVKVHSPTLYAVAELEAGSELEVPAGYSERAIYVVDGEVCVEEDVLSPHQLAVLAPGTVSSVRAPNRARVAIFGGEPLDGPRYLLWNFVSSRKDRLQQAASDWKHRRFATIPGDAEDRIPMPGE